MRSRARRTIEELKAPHRPRSAVQTTSRCTLSAPVPASKRGAESLPATPAAMLPSTRSIRSANGRAASAATCARRSLDAATICMALVIFCVALVEAMRTRMSFSEAILSSPRRSGPQDPTASPSFVRPGGAPGHDGKSSKTLGVTLDRALQLGGRIVAEVAAVADGVEDIDVLAAQKRQQTVLEAAHLGHRKRVEI